MATDSPIFGLRFDSNDRLLPSSQELRRFLVDPKRTEGQDLAAFRETIDELSRFEEPRRPSQPPPDLRERMYYGVLAHSSLFSPFLLTAVEQYLYHVHSLSALDFRKPSVFIASAEQELGRLDPKKKREAPRRERLRVLIEERRNTLAELAKRRSDLRQELRGIAGYIRDNLKRISQRCETAIVLLVHLQLGGKEEHRVIEDIKTRFKEELRSVLAERGVTREDLDLAKRNVEILTREIAALLREDIYALTKLYEAIYDHVRTAVQGIETPMTVMGGGKDEDDVYRRMEAAILSLVKDCRFPLRPAPTRSETAYRSILLDKRSEILENLFQMLHQERRARSDRRSGLERRKAQYELRGPEQRRGKDRRSEKRRRTEDRP